MKTITIISVALIIAGALVMFKMTSVWMLIVSLVLMGAGIFLFISYLMGDRQSKGDFTMSAKGGIHAYTQAEINTLRSDLALVKDVDEKVGLISRSTITECALAAQDMLNDDLDNETRFANAHLLVERNLLSEAEISQFKKEIE